MAGLSVHAKEIGLLDDGGIGNMPPMLLFRDSGVGMLIHHNGRLYVGDLPLSDEEKVTCQRILKKAREKHG